MKILLTGGSGFIGKNIIHGLEKDYDILAPSRMQLDLLDFERVKEYIKSNRVQIVIHAANTNHVLHPEDTDRMLDFNLKMFFNLYQCRTLYKRMFYFGSGAEYDCRKYSLLMEEDCLGESIPVDQYGFSKYIMGNIAEESDNVYELCLFGVYGRHEEWRRRFISNVIFQCMNSEKIRINHNYKFDYLYVEDLVNIIRIMLCKELRFHRYNICTGRSKWLLDIANYIRREMGCDKALELAESSEMYSYTGANDRLISEIGEFHFTELENGVKALIDYYRNNEFC